MPTVQFSFGDTVLRGEVVDSHPEADVTGPAEVLIVDVDGERYRTHQADALPA